MNSQQRTCFGTPINVAVGCCHAGLLLAAALSQPHTQPATQPHVQMALGHCNHPHKPCRPLTCHMYAIQLACADLASTTQSVLHKTCSCHSVQCQYSCGTLSGAPVACARCCAPGLWQRGTRNTASISDDAAFCCYNCQGRVNTIERRATTASADG
jgi:hypothetical protein